MDVHNVPEVLGANAGETPLPISVLPKGYDLYLAGHIHRHLNREIGGYNIVMPGSTVRTQLIDSEVEADRRFWILDTDSGKLEEISIPTARKGRVVRVDVSGLTPAAARDRAAKEIASVLAELPHDPLPIVKLVLTGKSEGILDFSPLVDQFSGRAIVRVFDNTVSSLSEAIAAAVAEHKTNTQIFSKDYARSVLASVMEKLGLVPGKDFDQFLSMLLSSGSLSSRELDAIVDSVQEFLLSKEVFAPAGSSGSAETSPRSGGATILDWSAP